MPHPGGKGGEEAACRFLRRKGYRILERNYRGPRYEVDIVALEGEILAFVEVKTRREGRAEEGAESVDSRKQARIVRAASHYLLTHPDERERTCRFDVALVEAPEGGRPKVKRLLRDAFR
ncbi:MAG: YraN family protein [bacterium]